MSSLFPGQFLSPIVTRSLAEVIDLTTAFVWIGAVMIVGVVGSGLAAVVVGLSQQSPNRDWTMGPPTQLD